MPNIYAHYFTGIDAFALLPDHIAERIDQDAYRFGLQGPDYLFYYNASPFRPNPRIAALGSAIHRRNVGEFLSSMMDCVLQETGRRSFIAASYMAGFLGHYALDTITHPFVYYVTKTSKYHTMFETFADGKLLELRGETLHSLPADIIVSAGNNKTIIADIYAYAISRAHGERISSITLCKAMDSFTRFMAKLDDPMGKIYKRYKRMEKLLLGYPVLSRVLHPPDIEDRDYLNLEHREWHKPWNKDFSSTSSLPDMMGEAAQLHSEYVLALYAAIDSSSKDEALQLFGQNSFLTGENWRLKNKGVYYDCIFDR